MKIQNVFRLYTLSIPQKTSGNFFSLPTVFYFESKDAAEAYKKDHALDDKVAIKTIKAIQHQQEGHDETSQFQILIDVESPIAGINTTYRATMSDLTNPMIPMGSLRENTVNIIYDGQFDELDRECVVAMKISNNVLQQWSPRSAQGYTNNVLCVTYNIKYNCVDEVDEQTYFLLVENKNRTFVNFGEIITLTPANVNSLDNAETASL